jgi:hypothetical protein
MATDNATSALGALLQHHSDVLDGDAMAGAWVAALPIKGDAVEAVRAHAQLVAMLEVGGRGRGAWAAGLGGRGLLRSRARALTA